MCLHVVVHSYASRHIIVDHVLELQIEGKYCKAFGMYLKITPDMRLFKNKDDHKTAAVSGIPVLSLKGFAKFSRVYTGYAVAAFFGFLARAVEVSSALLTSIHTYIYQHCTR